MEITHLSDQQVSLAPKTALAIVHLAPAVIDQFTQNSTHVDSESDSSQQKMDISGIDCNKCELTESQRVEAKELLEPVFYVFAGSGKDGGCAKRLDHEIHLTNLVPASPKCCSRFVGYQSGVEFGESPCFSSGACEEKGQHPKGVFGLLQIER